MPDNSQDQDLEPLALEPEEEPIALEEELDEDEAALAARIQPGPPQSAQPPKPTEDEKISLIEESEISEHRQISSVSGAGLRKDKKEKTYQRKLNLTGKGATRCRSFHIKMSDAALGVLDEMINDWLDQNPDIEAKFVTTTVGPVQMKIIEQHLVVMVWY